MFNEIFYVFSKLIQKFFIGKNWKLKWSRRWILRNFYGKRIRRKEIWIKKFFT